ncbi:uncharacterized protein J8A68_003615 [[Candida] subhashii]|uniref:G-patch domain-containing protein n=1 Tax=[Candida] subhashii TaxID=561895 RepID=A0A8J5QV75_9ASCO|nr:uncharacterized protein J8A68_003615 [[Candida] subhashii]KAG7662845.1 hypothetical protein J8A68_003615 [[Candida] subhashii]
MLRRKKIKRNIFEDQESESDSEEHDKELNNQSKKKRKLFKPPVTQDESSTDITSEGRPVSNELDYMDFKPEEEDPPVTSRKSDLPKNKPTDIKKSLFVQQPNVSSQSIGLSIMQKMGFKIGESLGMTNSSSAGITEPIMVQPRTGRVGLGGQARISKEIEVPEVSEGQAIEMKERLITKQARVAMIGEIRKLMKLCLELNGELDAYYENNDVEAVNELWRPYRKARHVSVLKSS